MKNGDEFDRICYIVQDALTRNDIAHEYFRFDTLALENISKFVSYRDGFKEIAELLRGFASNNDLLERIR